MRDSVPSARYSSVCNVLRYCVYEASHSSLLIESTDSMITIQEFMYRVYVGVMRQKTLPLEKILQDLNN